MSKKPGVKKQPKKMYDYFINEAVALLVRQGEPLKNAEKQAETFVLRVFEKLGGSSIYILKNTIKKAAEKRTLLKAELQGTVETVAEFARRNNITSSMAYYLLKESPTNTIKANNTDITLIVIEATRMLVVTGVSVQDAAYMAKDFVAVMMSKWIGRTIYFPSKKQLSVYKRGDDIWKQYQAGHKTKDIANRYGLTVAAVSQSIISRCKESGQTAPAERRKQNPLTLIHKRILQVAEDYREKAKGETARLLENVADQIRNIEKADNATNKRS